MKKFYIAAALFGLIHVVSPAQGKLSISDKAILNELRMPQDLSGSEFMKKARTTTAGADSSVGALVEITAGYSADDLAAAGAKVLTAVGSFATLTVPVDMVEEFAANPAVKHIQLDRELFTTNDRARNQVKVHQVHAGMGLSGNKYTGNGVIAGIYDVGIDVNHPAFMNADKSGSRINRLYLTEDTQDGVAVTVYSGTGDTQTASGDPINDFSIFDTDTSTGTHGTHTTATMAGGKGGSSTYYGMAPDADIAIGCGSSSMMAVATGITRVAQYGKEVGKPVVVNCSMGINSGTHDGTDVFSKMIDQVVEETNAIVSFSAGNEGDYKIGWHHAFDKTESLTTAFQELESGGLFYGTTEFIGNSAEPFKVTIVMADIQTGKVVETLASSEQVQNGFAYFATPGAVAGTYNSSTTINKYWTSAYYGIGAEVNEANGCYYVLLKYGFGTPATALRDEKFRYVPAFIVEGSAGQEVWGYCSGRYEELSSRGIASWTDGTANGSISNLACTKSVISVGAYVGRNSYKTSDGVNMSNSKKVGNIADFSSYGDLRDGRSLPTVCAPGSFVISAISYPYWISSANYDQYTKKPLYTKESSAQYEVVDGRINAYCDMQGTSMACPVVTGTMALWKQANPDLTVDEAKAIIAETAVKVNPAVSGGNATQWGAGKLDAIAGIKKVLEMGNAGVDALEPDARLLVTQVGPKSFEVFVSGETALRATMFNMSGAAVLSDAVAGDTMTIDASSLASGVYVVSVEGTTTHYSQRVLVK